jgi:hypothetical protein
LLDTEQAAGRASCGYEILRRIRRPAHAAPKSVASWAGHPARCGSSPFQGWINSMAPFPWVHTHGFNTWPLRGRNARCLRGFNNSRRVPCPPLWLGSNLPRLSPRRRSRGGRCENSNAPVQSRALRCTGASCERMRRASIIAGSGERYWCFHRFVAKSLQRRSCCERAACAEINKAPRCARMVRKSPGRPCLSVWKSNLSSGMSGRNWEYYSVGFFVRSPIRRLGRRLCRPGRQTGRR